MELKLYEQNGLELVVDMATGESFATYSGYARMAKIDKTTVTKRVKGVEKNKVKKGRIPTKKGIQVVNALQDSIHRSIGRSRPAKSVKKKSDSECNI